MNTAVAAREPDVGFGQIKHGTGGRSYALKPYLLVPTDSEVRARRVAALADLGSLAINSRDVADVVRAAVAVLQAIFDTDLVLVLRRLEGQDALSLEYGADGRGWLAPGPLFPAGADSPSDYALRSPTPVVVQNLGFDQPLAPVSFLGECDVSCGILAAIPGVEEPWGLLAAYSTSRASFDDEDLDFVRAVANAIASAIAWSRAQGTLESLVEDAPDPIARFDPELRIQFANAAMVLATGHSARDLLGHTFREFGLLESQLDGLEALVRAVICSGRERTAAFCLSSPLGERSYFVRFVPELATDGTVRSVLSIARDVTDHEKANDERALLQKELLERDRRHEELVQQLLAQQERSTEQATWSDYRLEMTQQLTTRETDILRLLGTGLTNKQIASSLRVSAGTVRNHLGRVFPKLDVVDRTQAAVRAFELGLIAPQSM